IGSAIFAYKAWSEAHEQAVQARRQADIAEQAFANTTRAWLKLTLDSAEAKRLDRTQAFFSFVPTYKNMGHTPAKNISFSSHVFVIGGGGPSDKRDVCEEARSLHSDSGEVVFPQDDGSGTFWGIWIFFDELRSQAIKGPLSVDPSTTVYLGMSGCLTYESVG